MTVTKFGRYVLDSSGVLHRYIRRYSVPNVVAIVHVKPRKRQARAAEGRFPYAHASMAEQMKQDCVADNATAVRARPFLQELDRCEGVAAESQSQERIAPEAPAKVTSGAATRQVVKHPANAAQTRPSTYQAPAFLPGKRPKIDLSAVPSSMEQQAASWRGKR